MDEETKKPIIISEILLQENKNLELVKVALEDTLKKVFGEGVDAGRFIDVTRIPLICQSVINMHTSQEEMRKDIKGINEKLGDIGILKKIVYGASAMILASVLGALIALVVIKN